MGLAQKQTESEQVGLVRGFADGNACVAEGGGFAEMGIGDEQGGLSWPPESAFWKEEEGLVGPGDGEGGGQD